MFFSPLRYPGGKNKLSAFIAKVCIDNQTNNHYVEPYAGGASVALFLLFEGFVEKITINDKDKSIYAFWYSVLNNSEELCRLIEKTDITIEEWKKQKEVQKNKENESLLTLGFSTLFLNRTNRSGIIKAGAIGGNHQKGEYKIDCRFNKKEIILRIKDIALNKNRINLFNLDAIDLIDKIQKEENNLNTIFYFDPPYFMKGSTLYMNHYKEHDHEAVSEKIKKIKNIKWIVSYDNVEEIRELYSYFRKKEYSYKHTAYSSREGQEVLFFSDNLLEPKISNWTPLSFKYKKTKVDRCINYVNEEDLSKSQTIWHWQSQLPLCL